MPKCVENLTIGPLYKVGSTLIQNILLWAHLVSKISLFYFNLYVTMNRLIPMKAHFNNIIFVTYIRVCGPIYIIFWNKTIATIVYAL
jgi:hypothetical protein